MAEDPGADDNARPRGPSGLIRLAPGVRVRPDALQFSFVSASGPGGQNVNRRSTKAVLRVTVSDLGLPVDAAARLRDRLGKRVTKDDEVIIACEEHRSQHRNRQACLDLLRAELVAAMHRPRARKPTRPTRGSVERRLDAKKQRSSIKKLRRRPPRDAGQ